MNAVILEVQRDHCLCLGIASGELHFWRKMCFCFSLDVYIKIDIVCMIVCVDSELKNRDVVYAARERLHY